MSLAEFRKVISSAHLFKLRERYKEIGIGIYGGILSLSIIIYAVILSALTSLKFYCFRSLAFDMGIFVQLLWQSNHGNPLYTQPRWGPENPESFFGVHFAPVVYPLIWLYGLVESPYLLLVIQSVALAAPAYYIYRIAERVTGSERTTLVFALAYLIYPATLWSNWYDFHLESFVPLLMAMMYHHLYRGSRVRFALSSLLLMAVMERMVFIVIAFSAYALLYSYLHRGDGSNGWRLDARSTATLVSLAVVAVAYYFWSESVINGIWPERTIFQPTRLLGVFTYESFLIKVAYLAILAAPLAFLQVNSVLELIPAAPYLILALATDYSPYFTINWQYPVLVSVPFFVSAIHGSAGEEPRRLHLKLGAAALISFVLLAPCTPLMSRFGETWGLHLPDEGTRLRHEALDSIPGDATVLAQENIFPNIAERETAYTLWPPDAEPPDFVVFNVHEYWFYHVPGHRTIQSAALELYATGEYGVYANVDGFIILMRGHEGPARYRAPLSFVLDPATARNHFISFEDRVPETQFYVPGWVEIEGGSLRLEPRFRGPVWWGPYVTVPPGNYTVMVRLEAEELPDIPVLGLQVYWYKHRVYADRVFWGGHLVTGRPLTAQFDVELTDWVPSLEVVGITYGNAEIRIHEVRFEERT